ncbi:MAG: D-alanyl-D-alanine carboxypeptidase family protein [Bacillota bacterium]|nr:D-alanyl-D-alanine carboxypeptidase family protein [Bacillota bacterium]
MHKKMGFGVFLGILLLLFFSGKALAENGPALNCKSALLLDGSSGEVLYEMNGEEKAYPASVTKIMTICLALEAVAAGSVSLDEQVMVSEAAASMGGSQVYLFPGESRSVEEMLIAIAVGSGNDASYAMAEFIGGSYENFIQMMNEKATELGMQGTNFANPHGLHEENHYTTARDLGKLAYYAIHLPGFLEYTSIYEYEFRPEPKLLTLWNTNRLLKWYEGTDGIKTGYTSEAGRNLVATAKREDLRLISVVLGCQERQAHFKESMDLLNYGFNSFSCRLLHTAGEQIASLPISKGKKDTIPLILKQDVSYTAQKNEQALITEKIILPPLLKAPVSAGDPCGELRIFRDGRFLFSVELQAGEDVEKASWFRSWRKLLKCL